VKEFRAAGGERLVTAGSCLEYDWNYGYCAESRTPCTPHTVYGTCKHALQLLTAAMARDGQLSSAWGRIFFLYGPYEHPERLVASVIRSLLAGEPARCSHGQQIRDYLFAGDIADAFVALLESDVAGPINIASGRAVALKDIVLRIGGLMGRPELIRLGAIPAAPTDVPLVVGDTARLSSALHWQPATDLDTGLQATIAWWRARSNVAVGGAA
jgi:nucleoside-diphosphate-sugar epimerase